MYMYDCNLLLTMRYSEVMVMFCGGFVVVFGDHNSGF
jgi:hypothetical protein